MPPYPSSSTFIFYLQSAHVHQEVSQELWVAAYVIDYNYDFSSALLKSILREGEFDYLDSAPTSADPSPSLSSSPLSSVPSSPFSSPLSSPPSSVPASPSLRPSEAQATLNLDISNKVRRKRERSKAASKRNRKKKKRNTDEVKDAASLPSHPPFTNKHIKSARPNHVSFSMSDDATVASTAYVGCQERQAVDPEDVDFGDNAYWLHEVVGPDSKFKFDLVPWKPGTCVPFADAENRAFAFVIGHPNDPEWVKCHQAAARLLEKLRPKCRFSAKQEKHRHGDFPALSTGISFGGGQTQPGNLLHNKANTMALKKLTSHWSFKRLSGFTTSVFKSWMPRLYQYYDDYFSRLLDSDDSLVQPFDNSVFSAAAFNFGPQMICLPHKDYGNLPFGPCFIWALGNYDYKTGGHIILWDAKKVVEFPPGTVIAIPSSVCRHSNTRVQKHERRYSFTQFSAGGLFRWVDYGFQTAESFFARLTKRQSEEEDHRRRSRWQMGLGLLPTLKDLGLQ